MTFCFLYKDKYFLSFYMLHAAFQKHAGEFETPAVSFQDLFEDPWALYSLFSSRVAAGSVLHADSKGTVSSLSVSPKSTWGWLVSRLWQLGHPSPTMVKARDICVTVGDKNPCFSIPVRCASMLKNSKAKYKQSEKMHSYAICSQNLDKNYTGEVEIITAGLFKNKGLQQIKCAQPPRSLKTPAESSHWRNVGVVMLDLILETFHCGQGKTLSGC